MGASIGTAIGYERIARDKHVIAVIGDSTFLHTGLQGLVDALYQGSSITLVLLNNRVTAMTGGQPNPASGRDIMGNTTPEIDFETLFKALGIGLIEKVDAYDINACRDALERAERSKRLSVIMTDRPCVMYPQKIKGTPLSVDLNPCNACGRCYNLGCPAISGSEVMGKKFPKALINKDTCTGCGLCVQVCPTDAII